MAFPLAEDAKETKAAARWRVPAALAMAALFYLLLLALGGRLLNDADTFWQIALGDWIVANGAVPHTDTFSWTVAGQPWISSQWLAQVIFAQAHALAGWSGVVVVSAAAIALAFGLLARFLMTRLAAGPALALTTAALVLASPHLVARPHALALPVMVAWAAGIMRAADENRAPSLWLLPLMALWANLHGGFTFGILFAAALGLEAFLNAAPAARMQVVQRWTIFGLGAVLAACVTPYGPESVLVTGRILGLGQALSLIGEWQPQDFSTFAGFELVLLGGIAYALYRGLTLPPMRLIILLGLLHMALGASRNSELLGLIAPLVIAAPLAVQLGRAGPREPARLVPTLAMIAMLAGVSITLPRALHYAPRAAIAPAAAVEAVKASGKTHLINDYDFGGYLIAQGVKPYIDGRTELYGEAFVMRHHDALALKNVGLFLHLLRSENIDVTLLAPATPAVSLLDRLDGWKRVYADGTAVVHVRTASAPQDRLQ